jgi:hypothetical protein
MRVGGPPFLNFFEVCELGHRNLFDSGPLSVYRKAQADFNFRGWQGR